MTTATSVPRRRGRLFVPAGLVLFVAVSFANASNYLFQVVTSRILGPSDYSLLGSVYAVITVVGVSTAALQTAAARVVASLRATGTVSVGPDEFTRAAVKWAIPASIVMVLASPFLAHFLHAGSLPTAAVGLYVLPAVLFPIAMGRLQGMEQFTAFALIAAGLAVARVALAPVALALGLGVTGVVVVSVILPIVAAIYGLWLARDAGPIPIARVRGDVGRATAALVMFWVMVSVDVPLARHALTSHAAGQYAAASVVGKGVLWLPGALSLIMLPKVTRLRELGEMTHGPLIRALSIAGLLCAFAVGALALLGSTVIPAFFGSSYADGALLAWRVALACLPFALANVVIFYHLTRTTSAFLVALGLAATAEFGGLAVWHRTPNQIVTVIGASGCFLLIALLVPGLRRRIRDARGARRNLR